MVEPPAQAPPPPAPAAPSEPPQPVAKKPKPLPRPVGAIPEEEFPKRLPWRPPRQPVEATLPAWVRIVAPFTIFAFAFGLYQLEIDHPPIIVFDEAHYVKVARNYTNGILIDPAWGDPRPQNFEHPPVGKYLIAFGIWLNGKPHNEWENQEYITKLCGHDNPECAPDARGWRFSSSVVGASGIAAAYFVGLRLFNRFSAGLMCGGLLLLDGLYFMHARLAMLDIFPTAFAIWAFAFVFSPFRSGTWLSGVFFGLALASKYYVLYLLPIFVLAQFLRARAPKWIEPVTDETLPPGGTPRSRFMAAWTPIRPWLKRLLPTAGWGLALPFGVLLLTYAPYFVLWTQQGGPAFAIREWVFVQVAAFTWDFAGKATHPFSSGPATWIPMIKPVYYYVFNYEGTGDTGRMWSVGNPFIWWTASIGILVVFLRVVFRFLRDYAWHFLRWDFLERLVYHPFHIHRDQAFLLASLLFLFAYLPWFVIQRITFLFYFTFVVPYLSIFAGGLLGEQWDRGGFNRILAILFAVIAGAVFLLYYPVVAGTRVSQSHYEWVMSLVPWMNWSK